MTGWRRGPPHIPTRACRVQELTTAGFNPLWPAYVRGLTDLQMGEGEMTAAEFRKTARSSRNRRQISDRSVVTPAARPFAELERRSRVGSDSPTRIPLDSGRTPIWTLLPVARPSRILGASQRCRSNGPTLVAYWRAKEQCHVTASAKYRLRQSPYTARRHSCNVIHHRAQGGEIP